MSEPQTHSGHRPLRLMLSGGGTSGHVNPALAMGQAFENLAGLAEKLYLGVRGRAEEVIVPKAGINIVFLKSAPFTSPRNPIKFFRFVLNLGLGCLKAAGIVLRFRPDYLLATGGYAAAPAVLSLALLRKLRLSRAKIVLHEANAVPGKLNRLMADWADHVFLTFPQAQDRGRPVKGEVAGYPVRQVLSRLDRAQALSRLGLELGPETKLVLIFGGSQGARAINLAVAEALGRLAGSGQLIFVLHAVGLGTPDHHPLAETTARLEDLHGPDWADRFGRFYRLERYIHDMASAYSAADLVVCRSGAGALFEICTLGRPVLLVPKPNLPADHQVLNARALAAQGGAEVLYEDLRVESGRLRTGLDGRELAQTILDLLSSPERLAAMGRAAGRFMAPGAAERIARLVLGQPVESVSQAPLGLSLPESHAGLLARLTRAQALAGVDYHPAQVLKSAEELAYYRHRSALLLAHPNWQVRNMGVKLVGLLKYEPMVEPLVTLLSDRTPVKGLKRFLGGDFIQVGFIRRNCLDSLRLIDCFNPAVEEALALALADPYFEVRSHAASTFSHFAGRLLDPRKAQALLLAALADRSFEVCREAALALGRVGQDEAAAEALLRLQMHRYWQVRQAAMRALSEMARRGILRPTPEVLERVFGFVVTATDFSPHFSIKATYNDLINALKGPKAVQSSPAPGGPQGSGHGQAGEREERQ